MFPKIERPGIAVLLKYGIPRKTYSEEVYIFSISVMRFKVINIKLLQYHRHRFGHSLF